MQFWNEMEGQTIAGLFPLQRLIRSEGRRAWFETRSAGPQAGLATVSLSEALTDADEIESRLKAAERLDNPNLVILNEVGRANIGQTVCVYALMEHVDQDLSGLLQNRPLTRDEAYQVALVLAGALTAIHQQGMFHGRVEPASVLAIGEKVKLRSDCLGSPGGSQAGDISGLGATLYQALTQRKAPSPTDPSINRLPAPFAEIVRNALGSRWNLAQITAALQPSSQPSSSVAPRSEPPINAGSAAGQPSSPESKTTPAHVRREQPPAAGPSSPVEADEPRPSRRLAIYVIAAIAVAFFLGWLIVRPRQTAKIDSKAPQLAARNSTARSGLSPSGDALAHHPNASARLSKRNTPPTGTTEASAPRRSPNFSSGSVSGRAIWRVVAYTYFHQDQAQHKSNEINRAHPELEASVFSPHGNSGPYLVIVGGAMDRPQAFAMRQKAKSLGLPRDTYAQNFTH